MNVPRSLLLSLMVAAAPCVIVHAQHEPPPGSFFSAVDDESDPEQEAAASAAAEAFIETMREGDVERLSGTLYGMPTEAEQREKLLADMAKGMEQMRTQIHDVTPMAAKTSGDAAVVLLRFRDQYGAVNAGPMYLHREGGVWKPLAEPDRPRRDYYGFDEEMQTVYRGLEVWGREQRRKIDPPNEVREPTLRIVDDPEGGAPRARPSSPAEPADPERDEVWQLVSRMDGAWREGDVEKFLMQYHELSDERREKLTRQFEQQAASGEKFRVRSVGGKDGGDLYAVLIQREHVKEDVDAKSDRAAPSTPPRVIPKSNTLRSDGMSSLIAIKTPRGWKVVDDPTVLNEDQAVRYPRLQAWAKEELAKRKQAESQKKVYTPVNDIAE